MADEGEAGGEAGGSVLKKYGPLAAIVLLMQVVLAWLVIQVTGLGNGGPDEPEEQLETEIAQVVTPEEEADQLPFLYTHENLMQIATNPAGTNMSRFVVVDIALGLVGWDKDGAAMEIETVGGEPVTKKIEPYLPRVESIIIGVLRSKHIDELESGQFAEVKDEIRKRLNQELFQRLFTLGKDEMRIEVKEVVDSGFVVQ